MQIQISSTSQVKETNVRIIKEALVRMGSATKIMTAAETGLSVATCNSILNELEAAGEILVVSQDLKPAGAGRPSKTYRMNEQFHLGCSLHLGNENNSLSLQYTVVDLLGKKVISEKHTLVSLDYSIVKDYLNNLVSNFPSIHAISIGLPGIISPSGQIESCDIESFTGLNLFEIIKEEFSLPCIVENDMNLIAYGLFQEKNYDTNRCVIAVSFFENICSGSGIVINKEIYHGKSNFAGEVSFLPFEKDHGRRIRLPLARIENSDMVAKTICAFVTILNPDVIMLTGKSISINMMGPISEACASILPKRHMPELTYVQNPDSYYESGLLHMTLTMLNAI